MARKRFLTVVVLPIFLSWAFAGSDSKAQLPSSGQKATLTNADIARLVEAGLSEEIILSVIGTARCAFDTSEGALEELKKKRYRTPCYSQWFAQRPLTNQPLRGINYY